MFIEHPNFDFQVSMYIISKCYCSTFTISTHDRCEFPADKLHTCINQKNSWTMFGQRLVCLFLVLDFNQNCWNKNF